MNDNDINDDNGHISIKIPNSEKIGLFEMNIGNRLELGHDL